MRVSNMESPRSGQAVANQFIIEDNDSGKWFQSYRSMIVHIYWHEGKRIVALDVNKWDYSSTTSKYRNEFLGETTAETRKKIKSGEYVLCDLN
jgi:hypothetical protein